MIIRLIPYSFYWVVKTDMHLFWGAWCYSDISHAFRWQLSANIKLRIKMACLLGND